jgi:DNA-directed RNA polymerase specialized sigma24 family protein
MRLDNEVAEYLGEELRRRYESGRSIRDIATETTYSIGRVRSLLHRANTPIRPRGAQPSIPAKSDESQPEPVESAELVAG